MRILCLLLWFAISTCILCDEQEEADYDAMKSISEYMYSYGYSFEIHKVLTADGYILTLWRIPKKLKDKVQKRPSILLQHGLMDNAFSWLYKRIERNLATILVDLGYDVWLGNNRGTIHSLEHKDIKNFNWRYPTNKYWEFTVDEMGVYDFPAMVDYILEVTGNTKLNYIGHSQGTAQFFVQSTINPEYINKKIKLFVALSPILYVENAPGLFLRLIGWSHIVDIIYWLKMKNFWTFPDLVPLNVLITKYFPRIMPFIVQLIAGWTKNQTLDLKRMEVISSSEPGGTSIQNLLNWIQLMRSGGFHMFDFGVEGNMNKYGQPVPPDYDVKNLKKLTIPILLMASHSDNIIGWNDLIALLKLLPPGYRLDEIDEYGHLDYIWADDAHVKIYPQIIAFIKEHQMKTIHLNNNTIKY